MKGKGDSLAMILLKAKEKSGPSKEDDYAKAREDLANRATNAMKNSDGAELMAVIKDMAAIDAE